MRTCFLMALLATATLPAPALANAAAGTAAAEPSAFARFTPAPEHRDHRLDWQHWEGSELDLARLPRNEQLAYWINLHNVAAVEALAKAYPLTDTAHRLFGEEQTGLHDAKLVRAKGMAWSPRDIRERSFTPTGAIPR